MNFMEFVALLHRKGLGELLTLHRTPGQIFLGKMIYEKDRLIVRDMGFLADIKPAQLDPVWDSGTIGMITNSSRFEWASLTFFGLEKCALPVDLSSTRHGALTAAENQYGDRLINFVGSVHRGYHLMLENHFLPVVLLKSIKAKSGEPGLVVSDLRAAPLAISIIRQVNDVVRSAVEKYLSLDVEDVEVTSDQFAELFKGFLNNDKK